MSAIKVGSAGELAELLRSRAHPRVHLCGQGSKAERAAAAPADTATVSLNLLNRIERFVADDLTCSVEPGLTCTYLNAELARHGLELPCDGDGSLGGMFAADPMGAVVHGGPSPRSLLLGLDGVLADGTPFKCGARVVKSVAGFDVHKLFVGSQGRLFAATLLHLKLRPVPRARLHFRHDGLDAASAIERLARLRAVPAGPTRLWLAREFHGVSFGGTLSGRQVLLDELRTAMELTEARPAHPLRLVADDVHGEVVSGTVRWSRLPALFAALPPDAHFLWHGGGRFEAKMSSARSDALLAALPGLDATGCVVEGSESRRGIGTPLDAGAERLQRELVRAFDPEGVLQ